MGRTRIGLTAVTALVVATGCGSYGAGLAADIPNPKPYTPPHPPDGSITSREPESPLEKRTNIYLMKISTPLDWGLLGTALFF
jgi:hypothetical protein